MVESPPIGPLNNVDPTDDIRLDTCVNVGVTDSADTENVFTGFTMRY